MKRLFISQPMRGKTNEEILLERSKAINYAQSLLNEDLDVIDSFFQDAPVDAKPLWYLGKSIELLATADAVIFIDGWSNARGCIIEHECAVRYGIPIIHE